jgi:two-component system response regulator MtrA
MAGLDGLQTCRAIRAKSGVPIIMVTSKPDGRSQALAAGATDYLTKPFSVDDLLERIESVLSRPRSAR